MVRLVLLIAVFACAAVLCVHSFATMQISRLQYLSMQPSSMPRLGRINSYASNPLSGMKHHDQAVENDSDSTWKQARLKITDLAHRASKLFDQMGQQWRRSRLDLIQKPLKYLTIPIVAALVGYITNWLGVSMLFYPTRWIGIPILRTPEEPLGLLGWQGIVPTKRFIMSNRMMDVTISKLITVSEVFGKLEPKKLASILSQALSGVICGGLVPRSVLHVFLRRIAADMIRNIEQFVDIRGLVVTGMTTDPSTLGSFFQKVGAKELKFLVESGSYFGFLLGLLQMVQWMLLPLNWTLPVGGAVVGLVTNWIALKWIFEPLDPTRVGPFVLQGMFLQRQKEVSAEFCSYLSRNTLNSMQVWRQILLTDKVDTFKLLIARNAPFLTSLQIGKVVEALKAQLFGTNGAAHALHQYTNRRLDLQQTLTARMNQMTPRQFEQVLHPIFQEDELTLIVAGGVLGMLAGLMQWWVNVAMDKREVARQKARTDALGALATSHLPVAEGGVINVEQHDANKIKIDGTPPENFHPGAPGI